ncbi:MAG: tetratricopeptide repeat protein [Oscillospiraceae bacterium]|jgi:cytochrome c-type biogenesis protein CcmH/NrfG|nr:tetratricopeptide repeat protein [Oscillospiraceae bacterium]
MQNPFAALGLLGSANAEQVRAAYHAQVKRCHPDAVPGSAEKLVAQEKLVRLNLAYAEALRQVSAREAGVATIPDAVQVARKLLSQGHLDSALRILLKAPARDAEFFALQGDILIKKGEAEAAHAAYRSAIRLDAQNPLYRQAALRAAVEMQRQKTIPGKISGWAKGLAGRMHL